MNIVDYYLRKEAGLGADIAQSVGRRLTRLGQILMRPKVLAPAAIAGGAAGMYGLQDLGQQRIQAEQEAAQMRQLLAENPELLNAGLMPDEQYE